MPTDLYEEICDAMEHPSDYWGAITDLQDQGWMLCFSRHRDSDHLQNSNFETILKAFGEKYELNDDFRVEGSSHWAVGWMDQMMVRALQCDCEDWEDAHITQHPDGKAMGLKLWRCHTCGLDFGLGRCRPIVEDTFEFASRLADYPVLDEEDFSRREYEEFCEWIENSIGSVVVSLQNDERIKDDFDPDMEKVFEYLFEVHNVSTVDECDYDWLTDAVVTIAEREGAKL